MSGRRSEYRSIREQTKAQLRGATNRTATGSGAMTDEVIEARYPPLVAKHLIARRQDMLATLPELRGMNLACWCPLSGVCHADLLLQLANEQ